MKLVDSMIDTSKEHLIKKSKHYAESLEDIAIENILLDWCIDNINYDCQNPDYEDDRINDYVQEFKEEWKTLNISLDEYIEGLNELYPQGIILGVCGSSRAFYD